MNTKWPRVRDHADVSCFNCGANLDGAHWSDASYAPGAGQFSQWCPKCGEKTYYDIVSETAQ